MKKLISLLMTLVMLTGTCAAFAEAEAVDHQAALEALLAEAGVELQPGDLSRAFEKALSSAVTTLVFTHTKLAKEQLTEWEAAMAAAYEAIEAMETEDAEQNTKILSDAIDGIESITPFTKSMLKREIFDGMYQRSAVTEKERQVIRAIYNALEAELHGADEARTEEIVAGIEAGMGELFDLHDVHDDMVFLLKFLQEESLSTEDLDGKRMSELAEEILIAADQVMGNRIEEPGDVQSGSPVFGTEAAGDPIALWEHLADVMEMMDEKEMAEVETHIKALADAEREGDHETLTEETKYLFDEHLVAKLAQRNYEVLLGMEDEELRVLAVDLLAEAHAWQSGDRDGTLMEELSALELNWEDLSEEDMATIKEVVAQELEGTEIPEGTKEGSFERLVNGLVVLNGFSEEESEVRDSLEDFLHTVLEHEVLDAAELAELENEMETLLYELAGDSEQYQVNLDDMAAVLENVDLKKLESLSDAANSILTVRFMERFEMFSMLPEEAKAKLPEVDQALFEAMQGLEVNGEETTMEQLQALEKAVYDVLSRLDVPEGANVPKEVVGKEVAKTVSNCLLMSSLTAEEQEIVESALEAISQALAEGNREEIRALRNYYHLVQHYIEEGRVRPQMQDA